MLKYLKINNKVICVSSYIILKFCQYFLVYYRSQKKSPELWHKTRENKAKFINFTAARAETMPDRKLPTALLFYAHYNRLNQSYII